MKTQDNILTELDREIKELEASLESLRETRKYFSNKKKSLPQFTNTVKISLPVSENGKDKFAPTVRNIILQNEHWFSTLEIFELLKSKYPDKVGSAKKETTFKGAISFVLSEAKHKGNDIVSIGNSKKNYRWGKSEWVDAKGKPKPDFLFNLNEIEKGTANALFP
jgi:hypothetical protein